VRSWKVAALVLLAQTSAFGADAITSPRVSAYDFQAQYSDGRTTNHDSRDKASLACANWLIRNSKGTCFVQGGKWRVTATLPGPPPGASITATAASVVPGTAITLTWSCANATSALASGAWGGVLPLSGSKSVAAKAGTYSVSCIRDGVESVADVVVTLQ
jgi:hypothetical protein